MAALTEEAKRNERESKRRYDQTPQAKASHRRSAIKQRRLLKIEVISHYTKGKMACQSCGFDNIKALSVDHKNGDGARHRRLTRTNSFYRWVKKSGFPDDLQILCMNCQFIKRYDNREFFKKDAARLSLQGEHNAT